MSLHVSFDLNDDDLEHFRLVMREARQTAAKLTPEDIVASAEALLSRLNVADAPGFIVERLGKLGLMIRMISDVEWRLPHEETSRVLNALAYFAEPDDLIPDDIPGLGFLDDAIMIELVIRELQHEIEAYEDFCEFREAARKQDAAGTVSREVWLNARREELQSRMRQRRNRTLRNAGQRLRLFD